MTHQLVRTRPAGPPLRCATCHGDLRDDDARWTCSGCATALHEDCADGLGRCATTGCHAPRAAARREGTRPASRPRDAAGASSAAVYVVPAVAALLWPLTFLGLYLLLEATVFPPGTWLRLSWHAAAGALIGAGALPLVLGNGVLAPRAGARGLPGRHQLRALAGALGGAAAGTAILALVLATRG